MTKIKTKNRKCAPAVAVHRVVSQSRTCKCDICQKWAPLHRRIMAKLRGKDLKLFDEYLMMNANDSDELGCANAKLAGEWPEWEWIKEAVKEQERKQANDPSSPTPPSETPKCQPEGGKGVRCSALLGDLSVLTFDDGIEIRGADNMGNAWIPKDKLQAILPILTAQYNE